MTEQCPHKNNSAEYRSEDEWENVDCTQEIPIKETDGMSRYGYVWNIPRDILNQIPLSCLATNGKGTVIWVETEKYIDRWRIFKLVSRNILSPPTMFKDEEPVQIELGNHSECESNPLAEVIGRCNKIPNKWIGEYIPRPPDGNHRIVYEAQLTRDKAEFTKDNIEFIADRISFLENRAIFLMHEAKRHEDRQQCSTSVGKNVLKPEEIENSESESRKMKAKLLKDEAKLLRDEAEILREEGKLMKDRNFSLETEVAQFEKLLARKSKHVSRSGYKNSL